jgi:hypothetical protein
MVSMKDENPTQYREPTDDEKGLLNALDASFASPEGCLCGQPKHGFDIQAAFLERILRQVNPSCVLEFGTHKAHFCLFAKLVIPDVKVITLGNREGSGKAVDILNAHFGRYITFILGDSKETWRSIPPLFDIGFAWVDGGHDYDTCLSDLISCVTFGVEHICVDDYRQIPEVERAVNDFVEKSLWYGNQQFHIKEVSSDERGIAYLCVK